MPGVKTAVFYGGTSAKLNEETLKTDKPQIIVGTPGRLCQLIRDKILILKNIKHFILDECDKLLESLGIYFILTLNRHAKGCTGHLQSLSSS